MTERRASVSSDPSLVGPVMRWFEEYASAGVVTTDERLIIRSWNRWLATATGLPAAQVIGRVVTDVFPSLVERGLAQYYADALAGEFKVVSHTLHRYIFPSTRVAASRERMLQSGRIAPLYDNDEIVGTITIVEDVSERVASERELRAQIVTAEAARLAAESASRVKDEFLATLSHEIRTPLNAVLGWTRILRARDEFDEPTVRRAIEVIDRNAMSQLTLISDMLDMARIAAGKVRLEKSPVDLVAVTMAAIDVVRPGADSKGITLIPRLSTEIPPVLGDPDRLQQVVWNLLSNAIKFTDPPGSVTITLDCTSRQVQLTVEDTGQGISAEFLPEIFQRFKQSDASSSRRHGGLGLGLALVNELVALHDGKVFVESAGPGQGARFTVQLAVSRDTQAADGLRATEDQAVEQRLDGVRVLVIEDDPDAREILGRTIVDAGGAVVSAASSAEGLAALRGATELPHVIVTDIGMPTDDGYAFLRTLRQTSASEGGGVPAVALTAFATAGDRTKALAAGFATHLTKPVAPARLVHAIAVLVRP